MKQPSVPAIICLLLFVAWGFAAQPARAMAVLTPTDSVDISLAGLTLKSGLHQSRTNALDGLINASEYSVAITGTCEGTGAFASIAPAGTSIGDALDQLSPGSSEILTGSVFNLKGRLPLKVANKSFRGHNTIAGIAVNVAGRVKLNIAKTGAATIATTGITFKLQGKYDRKDSLVFGSDATCSLQALTTGPSANPQPDLMLLEDSTFVVGNDIYSNSGAGEEQDFTLRKGHSATFVVLVQNDGMAADTITLTGTSGEGGFKVKYLDAKNKDITAAVEAGTYSISALAPTDFVIIKIRVTVTTATSGQETNAFLYGTSSANGHTDQINADVTAK